MRLYTIVSTLVGVAITLGNPIATLSDLVPADIYALNVAPIHLARLEAYKFDNAGTLTSEQAAVLDHAISVIRTQAVAEEPAVREACESAFGSECAFILTGHSQVTSNTIIPKGVASASGLVCSCSQRSDWCSSPGFCAGVINPPCVSKSGCGSLGLYTCTGICAQ